VNLQTRDFGDTEIERLAGSTHNGCITSNKLERRRN
jgi:hypothetical protein